MSAASNPSRQSRATPAPPPRRIRPGLLIALLLMLAATVWALLGDDGDDAADARSAKGARSGGASSVATAAPQDEVAGLPAGARSLRAVREAQQRGATEAPTTAASAALQDLSRQVAWWQARGAFEPLGEAGSAAWASKLPPPPPPVQAPPPPPPPPPMAPRFPYQWVGCWQEHAASGAGTSNLAVISGPEQTWVVKPGDVIEGQWRVDAVTDRALQLTYLPLSQTQTISMRRT